jgi:septal ring factor EnvC (AmiA/AmiB activator)
MTRAHLPILLVLAAAPALAWGQNDDLAQIKEQELEEVRERISALKESMDKSAGSRDRITSELQEAEVEMSEKRLRLKELQRERDYSTKRKQELNVEIAQREEQLSTESEALAQQVRAAHMSGGQERIKLLLSQIIWTNYRSCTAR